MKSEFLLAFNEICDQRHLSRDTVLEALKTALVSAYRRNIGVGNNQHVVAEVDSVSGEPRILAEKEVVEKVQDWRTEVSLAEAHKYDATAQLGSMALVDSTPPNFGRIAAQTAKQVILQRIREAERDKLFEDFSDREGEVINGTVQSITPQQVTIGLGRTEAVMPKAYQVPGERYKPHDKIRVYVVEVRKTNRGPQIIVARNHRNMLRRLLEYEVPEIYKGAVEIKAIAREAGARSKVAVAALQDGVDPVGACVGLRGVRIQSIVKELSDEKIDVIEWSPDQATFIAKSLSPAKVSGVFLDEDPIDGRTALVVVPDDQLSLAIGREGQNARLAAKLTGWRIDIKSLTEAATEILNHPGDPIVAEVTTTHPETFANARVALEKRQSERPLSGEEWQNLSRVVALVENARLADRQVQRKERLQALEVARARMPQWAFQVPVSELDLPNGLLDHLAEVGITTVSGVMERLLLGEHELLRIKGVTPQLLDGIRERLAELEQEHTQAQPAAEGTEGISPEPTQVEPDIPLPEAVAAPSVPVAVPEPEIGEVPEVVVQPPAEVLVPAPVVELVESEEQRQPVPEPAIGPEPEYEAIESGEETEEEGEPWTPGGTKKGKGKKKKQRKQLVYDESLGTVVAHRERKPSRQREWEDY